MGYGKNRGVIGTLLAGTALGLLLFLGCNVGTPSDGDLAEFQKVFMSSYYAERGGNALGAKALTPFRKVQSASGKATVNVGYLTDARFASLAPVTLPNYPEVNQTTTFTVTAADADNHVYGIVATTTFPSTDARSEYVEEYYVRDIGINPGTGYFDTEKPDGIWDANDPIVTNGSGSWVQDQTARVQQVLTFADGTTRSETIVRQSDSAADPVHFAAFDIGGSLDFSQTFFPDADADAQFSSIVIYKVTPSRNYGFWFWSGSASQTILGVRYYTEFKDAANGRYYGYTICFEKTVSEYTTATESFPSTMTTVFARSTHDTLAESVLRQETAYALDANGYADLGTAVKTTNMKSRVVDITTLTDFDLTQMNDDYVELGAWDTTSIYIPTGEAEEVVAAGAGVLAYLETRSEIEQADGLTIPIATATPGTGDVATLYASLTTGAYTLPTTTATPSDSLQGTNAEWSFDGSNIGTLLGSTAAYELSTTGTVEAWIYMNSIVNTAGIVHKGVLPDFSDECYSLQLWGNAGQIGIVLDSPTGSTYDSVLSKKNLNKQRWYHIVATWDTVTAKKICLYLDGSLNNSATPNKIAASGCRNNGSDLVIGSQLPSLYSTLYGYFSFDGKIVGTRIYAAALTASEVLSNYNAYKDLTSGW